MKNIVFCLRHDAFYQNKVNKPTFCGLGDIIRGLIFTYAICKGNEFEFFFDCKGHSLEPFLNNEEFSFPKEVPEKIPFVYGQDLVQYIRDNIDSETVFLMSNGHPQQDEDILFDRFKNILKKIFLSNSEISNLVNLKQYNHSFHARFGDDENVDFNFLQKFYVDDGSHQHHPNEWFDLQPKMLKYQKTINFFKDILQEIDFVCSDHDNFKSHFSKFKKINFFDKGSHTGIISKEESHFNTLCDFYALYNSKKITSISSFPYGIRKSAFPLWASKISGNSIDFYNLNYKDLSISSL